MTQRTTLREIDTTSGSPGQMPAIDPDGKGMSYKPPPVPTGGSVGQVLSKASSVDYDTTWSTPSSGSGGSGLPRVSQPQGSLLRSYHFDTDVQSWTADGGTLAWDSAGRLQHTAPTATNYTLLEPSTAANLSDGEFVADAYSVANNTGTIMEISLVFRATDANNHYMLTARFGSTSGQVTTELYKKVSGTYTSLGASAAQVSSRNQRWPINGVIQARLMVRFVGGHIRFYVNEELQGLWNDSTFTSGRCGLRHYPGTTGQITTWDNALVYSLPAGWAPSPYA